MVIETGLLDSDTGWMAFDDGSRTVISIETAARHALTDS